MHQNVDSPWIVAQLLRVRNLEKEVKRSLASGKAPLASLRSRMAELKVQLDLLDLALGL